ncbi:MAG: LLM class flavin-dependent oxidoreductase [Acidimicrobiia bacterium]
MLFGLQGAGAGATRGEAARGRELEGYDFVGSADTQAVAPDVYCVLTEYALATKRIQIGPFVTNASTRMPVVTASAIATIDALSHGRAFMAIGTGKSATANAGLPPASPEDLARAVTVIASAFRPVRGAREDVEWPKGLSIDETVVALPSWVTRRVPIYVSASGPKALRIAAEMGDGVILSPGDVPWDTASEYVAQLRSWRDSGPRAGDPFLIVQNLRCFATDSIEEGRAAIRGTISAHARYTRLVDMPEELRDAQRRYRAEYRWEHVGGISGNPVNLELMESLGLADYMFERYAIIGDDLAIARAVRRLEDAGIDGVAGVPPSAMATYREVMAGRLAP